MQAKNCSCLLTLFYAGSGENSDLIGWRSPFFFFTTSKLLQSQLGFHGAIFYFVSCLLFIACMCARNILPLSHIITPLYIEYPLPFTLHITTSFLSLSLVLPSYLSLSLSRSCRPRQQSMEKLCSSSSGDGDCSYCNMYCGSKSMHKQWH